MDARPGAGPSPRYPWSPSPAIAVETEDYQVPFRFTGNLNKLTIALKGPPLSEEQQQQMRQQRRKNDAAQ
jgi:hypothetical protein